MKNQRYLLLCVFVFFTFSTNAEEDSNSTVPFAVAKAKLAGEGLDAIDPFPADLVLGGGDPSPKLSTVFSGDIVYGVFESNTTKLAVADPWPYDEFVLVLAGELRLTDDVSGKTQVFPTGTHLIVPKGFSGTWEHVGQPYREVFVIERKTFEAVWGGAAEE